MSIYLVSQCNVAPTEEDENHHVYYISIDDESEKEKFILCESIGGGHSDCGGEVRMSFNELLSWEYDWKLHLRRSGCTKEIIEMIESSSSATEVQSMLIRYIEDQSRKNA